jgi:hypothetical protein
MTECPCDLEMVVDPRCYTVGMCGREKRRASMTEYVDIVFDGPPGRDGPRLIEVENDKGQSISLGAWLQRPDGYWVLRFDRNALTKGLERNK